MVKKLFREYQKRLNKLNRIGIKDTEIGFEYFITFLRSIRDKLILATDADKIDTDMTVQTICSAINEYNLIDACADKYFKMIDETTDLSEEIQRKYTEEKRKHETMFWSLVSANLQMWTSAYGNTI